MGGDMTFSRYKDYVLAKQNSREITVSFDNYKNYVASELSGLVLRKTRFYDEAKDLLINHHQIEEKLSNCPYAENIKIALKSNNLNSMKNCLSKYKEAIDSGLYVSLESSVFNYESKCLGQMFNAFDVDVCVQSLIDECQSNVEKLKGFIFKGLLNSKLEHLPVHLEVCKPEELKAEAVIARIDYILPIIFIFNLSNLCVESLNDELPPKVQKIHDDLLEFFNNKSQTNTFVTGFLADDSSNKKIYENKQKELALGMKTFLEKDAEVFKTPPKGNFDIWEVKIKNPTMFETIDSFKLTENAQIRWLNLIRRSRNEK